MSRDDATMTDGDGYETRCWNEGGVMRVHLQAPDGQTIVAISPRDADECQKAAVLVQRMALLFSGVVSLPEVRS